MVKQKAEINLDEWLEMGVLSAETNRVNVAAATAEKVSTSMPTVVGVPLKEKANLLPNTPADVAESESSEWFWVLLEQSGYERW